MKTICKTILISICLCFIAAPFASAIIVPAGTTLIVRTTHPISSHERVGRTFKAELDRDVMIKGNVLLPAGTTVAGVVEKSLGDRRSNALTVNITAVSVSGRMVPLETTGGFELQSTVHGASTLGVPVYRRGYSFSQNARMAFRLAQPLNL